MHLIATSFYGGPEKQINEHLVRLNRTLYRGIVASFIERSQPNEILQKADRLGLRTCSIPVAGPLDTKPLNGLRRLLKEEAVELLCMHGYKACVLGWIAARRARVPTLAFARGYTTESLKVALYEWLERLALRRMDGIVAVSEAQRRRLESLGVRGPRMWVVHNAVCTAEPRSDAAERCAAKRESLGVPLDVPLVIAAGRFSPEKGHRYLIEAVAVLNDRLANARFLFCGDGACRGELERIAARLGISSVCRFIGFRRDLPEIFEAMDLLVLPSLTEGLPNVVLEAFSARKPVVATAVGGVPEVVVHGENGLLVPPQRADLLAEAIGECLADANRMAQFGEAGFKKVAVEFTFESQSRKLESVYDMVLHARGRLPSCLSSQRTQGAAV